MKKMGLLSIVVASMILDGCRSGHHDSDKNTKVEESKSIKSIKSIAKKLVDKDKTNVDETIHKISHSTNQEPQTDTTTKRSRSIVADNHQGKIEEECDQSGSMIMEMGDDYKKYISQINSTPTPPTEPITHTMKISALQCDDGDGTINGKITIKTLYDDASNSETTVTTFDTDFTISDTNMDATIKKGGTITEESNDKSYTTTTDINATGHTKGIAHSVIAQHYVERITEHEDGGYENYPISGKISIDGSLFLTVDPDYDASQTPIVYDTNGKLQKGGLAKYHDEPNHQVEVQATDIDELTIWVDENGNTQKDSGESAIVE